MPGFGLMHELWDRVSGAQPVPPGWVIAVSGAIAVLIVLNARTWHLARNSITIAHEGGHALASVLSGRRLDGIRLHSDTSGVTYSRGRRTGPGLVLTSAAGYLTPSLLADVVGQPVARPAAGICAAGGHHILLLGPLGTGKPMRELRSGFRLTACSGCWLSTTPPLAGSLADGLRHHQQRPRPANAPHHYRLVTCQLALAGQRTQCSNGGIFLNSGLDGNSRT